MTWLRLLLLGVLWPCLALAQQQDNWAQDDAPQEPEEVQDEVTLGTGVVLRGIDKVSGYVDDLEVANGEAVVFERLNVELGECRYPTEDAALDAYAFLTIRYTPSSEIVFQGWMLASSPALNAMEHPRYDVWVLRCRTE